MNKIFKIVFTLVGLILVLWGIIFTIDYVKCSNFKEPIFVVAGETADEGGSGTYYGLGYKVKIEKNISAQYGIQLVKVEMYMFDKFITGAIADVTNVTGEKHNSNKATSNSFVGTILEETTSYMIVEPNEDEVERKSSDKIVVNYGTDHIDYLYGVGRKVLIKYDGYIMETYPAQINTNNISTNGYEEFNLEVKKSNKVKKSKVLNNKELYKHNLDYNLYYYGLDEVEVTVYNKIMPLESALRSGKITIAGILARANKDESEGKIKSTMYKDGGTKEWYYNDYTIIKCNSLSGNRDVYIGISEMRLNVIK